ncbi:MAG: hypothetical protein JOS17DRAFT_747024, partial [Linnemannia elongata]
MSTTLLKLNSSLSFHALDFCLFYSLCLTSLFLALEKPHTGLPFLQSQQPTNILLSRLSSCEDGGCVDDEEDCQERHRESDQLGVRGNRGCEFHCFFWCVGVGFFLLLCFICFVCMRWGDDCFCCVMFCWPFCLFVSFVCDGDD